MFEVMLVFVVIVIISVVLFLIIYNNATKYAKFVQAHSRALRELEGLNNKYHFCNVDDYCEMQNTYDNELFYDQISCRDYLIYELRFEQRKIIESIKKIDRNKLQYEKYYEDLKRITLGNYDTPYEKLKINKLIRIETKLYNRRIRKPQVSFSMTVTLRCSKINGEVYDEKSQTFNKDDIYHLVKRINNKTGFFFNDRAIWDAICRVERGKVSNKIRFDIYRRDNYRCCICGASQKDTNLEIDHIIPIAKGGKSENNNLQTLCHRCNVEKGMDIPYKNKRKY